MAERNMIREGFVANTSAPDGSVSGTQVVSISQINDLTNGNVFSTALLISGSFFTSLDADLGARWKLDRLELYTDDSTATGVEMSISDTGEEFFPVTMTGSAGLWVGDVDPTAVSGAPRYIRYYHYASSDTVVQEWKAINDETLVNFGSDGSQTEVQISDAPIGSTSTQTTTLTLRNDYNQTAQGFVYIDDTGTSADEYIELSLLPSGPFVGQQTQISRQPNVTTWADEVGVRTGNYANAYRGGRFASTQVISGTGYSISFETGEFGWSATGFDTQTRVSGRLRGERSNSLSPSFDLDQDYGNTIATSPDAVPDLSNGFIPFRADYYDTVSVILRGSALPTTAFVEGPRLFWKTHESEDNWTTAPSVLSTTPYSNLTGSDQTFTFEVSQLPTWSGLVRSFRVQPYTITSGTGFAVEMASLEVTYSGSGDRVALADQPVISGSFTGKSSGSLDSTYHLVVNTENPVKEPCIITSVSSRARAFSADIFGWFLCRFKPPYVYNEASEPGTINSTSEPFEVLYFVTTPETHSSSNQAQMLRMPVFWGAQPGDMIGCAYRSSSFGGGQLPYIGRDSNLTVTTKGCLASAATLDLRSSQTLADVESDLNAINSWALPGYRFNAQFAAVSAGRYYSTGTYTSPIFDGGGDPALLSVEYESVENNGTGIDLGTGGAYKTIEARASNVSPNTAQPLGIQLNTFFIGSHPADAPPYDNPYYASNYVLGIFNEEVSARETADDGPDGDDSVENLCSRTFFNDNTQELWALNILISGTQSTDLRPIWDVLDFDTGEYIRTQAVSGPITYFHENDGYSGVDLNTFEPVGWLPDYDRDELYIVTRQNEFSVGAGTYNGLILELSTGDFVNVFWRSDQILDDMVDKGLAANTGLADRYLLYMRDMAYRNDSRGKYFFALTTGDITLSDRSTHILVFRYGDDPLNPTDPYRIRYLQAIQINAVPGFGSIDTDNPFEVIEYCPENDLFYLFTRQQTTEIYTMQIEKVGTAPNETFTASQGSVYEDIIDEMVPFSQVISGHVGLVNLDGYTTGPTIGGFNWDGGGVHQELRILGHLSYSTSRDSFSLLAYYNSQRTRDFLREGEFSSNNFRWRQHSHAVIMELAADTQGKIVDPPMDNVNANTNDPLWGTASGTLVYTPLQQNSILFPTGRYGQVRYTLNSDSENQYTPFLLSSRLSQGLRVSDIPASGTKDIYLRTNIPENESIGAQVGRLKIYWQLEE